jgi:hypothetical protein
MVVLRKETPTSGDPLAMDFHQGRAAGGFPASGVKHETQ